jgi:hypothetical protein
MPSKLSIRPGIRAAAFGTAAAVGALGAAPSIAAQKPRARAAGTLLFTGRTKQCLPDIPRCGKVTIRVASDLSTARFSLEWEARCHPNNGELNLRERHKILNLPLRLTGSGGSFTARFNYDQRDSALYKSKPGAAVPLELQVDERIRFSGALRINRNEGSGRFTGRIKLVQTTPGQVLRRTCTPEGGKIISWKVQRA